MARLDPARQSSLGQFFTPRSVAFLMASLHRPRGARVRLVDPGAGVGVLTAACVAASCSGAVRPADIHATTYELDERLVPALSSVLEQTRLFAADFGVRFTYEVLSEDFIQSAVDTLTGNFVIDSWQRFDVAILNPPYKKIRRNSVERELLRTIGVETSNLYTAFVALALRGVVPGGELIAITPRSFCNGPYFTPFRRELLRTGKLTHIHVFDSRNSAFEDDAVLQENVVFRVERDDSQPDFVQVEWSASGDTEHTHRRDVPYAQVVRPNDADCFIHVAPDEWDSQVADIVRALDGTLASIDVQVSTGRVVDFRAKEFLYPQPRDGTVPLIYPTHFHHGRIAWPKVGTKKPNALGQSGETRSLLNPTGTYVLVKRFSSKEERRRLVAAVFAQDAAPSEFVAFENHLNYFHRNGAGLPTNIAWGISTYLNSTILDNYFRQFNGHTQVNATDLRKLPYPNAYQLERIGKAAQGVADQDTIDSIVEGELLNLVDNTQSAAARKRIREAVSVLEALGLPKEQTNERAALTLLALLELPPNKPWSAATARTIGVTPIMEFVAAKYGKQWAPNTRETVRRFTLHQFLDAGVVVANPDKPGRPVNSPGYCYQVPEATIKVLRSFGTRRWDAALAEYMAVNVGLAKKYASERTMKRIPLHVRDGVEIKLSPGGQNELIRRIVEDFCPRFTPGGDLLYIGDADEKFGYFDAERVAALGVRVDSHGKMPDVVVHLAEKNWLVVIEAVTSHGPVNPKRHGELKALFGGSSAALVFVTAFLTRQIAARYMVEIAWETEVWSADAPTHMVHFNGERFLGPYE
jgi:adenine-specific DNA-methyltransferase